MAPSRSKAPTNLGSTQWILSEREQVQHIADLDAEEFAFSVRNEVDWLNEHMAEIFDENQLNIAEIFKTPGKLRGKTPRTARKRNILEIRAPLTDVFSANQRVGQSPSHQTQFYKQVAHFQVAEDPVLKVPNEEMDAEKPPQVGKGNTDSGYHGMSEDEMDVDPTIGKPERLATIESSSPRVAPSDGHKDVQMSVERSSQGQRTTEGSFHSAKEPHPAQIASKPNSQEDMDMERNEDDEALSIPLQTSPKGDQSMHLSQPKFALPLEASPITSAEVPPPENDLVLEDVQTIDDMRSPSEGSSPVRALVRKSSLTFASLPAREPLATKKSIGARNSRTSHLDQTKMAATNRGSYFGRHTDGKSLGDLRKPQPAEEADGGEEMDVDEEGIHPNQSTNEKPIADTTMTVLHNKSSTQRLHDKINMLGQSQPSRPTKSIPSIAAVTAHLNYHDLPRAGSERLVDASKGPGLLRQALGPDMQIFTDDDEDDWIQPPPQMKNGNRPQVTKRLSTEVIEEVVVKHSISGKEVKPSVASSTTAGSRQASPLRHAAVPTRPMNSAVPAKSASTSVIGSVSKVATTPGGAHKGSLSASNPGVANVQGEASITTTTPAGTPKSKHNVEGPLSASKAKLQSIMKGARGLFTSSAGISAQAKMETISPPYIRNAAQVHMSSMDDILGGGKMSEDAFRILGRDVNTVRDSLAEAPADPSSPPKKAEGRKTRSSTEREEKRKDKEAKERQRAEEEVSTAQGKERQKVATQAENEERVATHEKVMIKQAGNNVAKGSQAQKQIRQSPRHIQKPEELVVEPLETEAVSPDVEMMDCPQAMAPPPPRDQTQTSQMQKPKDIRRPIKPAREAAPKPKPQPVAIRVGTLSQRVPLSNSALSSTLQDSLPPPGSKQPSVAKTPSNHSLQSSMSNPSLKSSVSAIANKPKALLAAERKKEQDAKEAQRKLEQKREIERKRAAQQEEARRQEQQQRREAERQREKERAISIEEPKKIAQKQAIEKRRLENAKKAEQHRNPQRPGNDLTHALQQEKAQPAPAPHRGELGNTRPTSRMNSVQDFNRVVAAHPLPNVAKPAKRPAEDESFQRPGLTKAGAASQANDAKRRRTDDEEVQEVHTRPTMAPPIRQSNIRKDAPKPSIFSHGYTSAPPPPSIAHAAPSLLKSTTNNQFQQINQQQQMQMQSSKPVHPMDMANRVTGKIPFAEAPNPPHPAYRTPLPSKQPAAAAAKSSPIYPNGDSIELPEIATDSEDEDSDDDRKGGDAFAPPDWANSPQLREILEQQQSVDPDKIFGPIAPPQMEKMFTNKDRHHRFRSRTSSANWSGPDRLTEEEIRSDAAAREKMRRQGGWTYGL